MINTAGVPSEKLEIYATEAKDKSLELLELLRVDGNLRGNYKRLSCGHTLTTQVSSIRHNKNSHCNTCMDDELLLSCEAKGLTFIGPSSDGSNVKRSFQFKSCGHTTDLFYSNITKKSGNYVYKCLICYEKHYQSVLKKKNLTEIEVDWESVKDKTRANNYGTFIDNNCGHKFSMMRHHIEKSSERCWECKRLDFLKLVESRGLILNGKAIDTTLNDRYMNFTIKKCGHSRDIDPICVERNNFKCLECNDTFTKQPSNIYLFEIKSNDRLFLKLGYGKTVKNRIREYGLVDGLKAELLHVIPIENGRIAMRLEISLHNSFINERLSPVEMKQYFKRTGHTECYPYSMKDTLIMEMSKLI